MIGISIVARRARRKRTTKRKVKGAGETDEPEIANARRVSGRADGYSALCSTLIVHSTRYALISTVTGQSTTEKRCVVCGQGVCGKCDIRG